MAGGWLWLVYWHYNINTPAAENGILRCPFMRFTGYPCPSCGSTHAVLHLLKLEWKAAIMANPFGYIIALAMLGVPLIMAFDAFTRRETLYRLYCKAEIVMKQRKTAVVLIFVTIINWAWNLYKYSL